MGILTATSENGPLRPEPDQTRKNINIPNFLSVATTNNIAYN